MNIMDGDFVEGELNQVAHFPRVGLITNFRISRSQKSQTIHICISTNYYTTKLNFLSVKLY